jgi:nicotinate phosphoribosyltransferase
VSTPGRLQVRRYAVSGEFVGDVVYDIGHGIEAESMMIDPLDPTRRKRFGKGMTFEDLLVPVMRGGKFVYDAPKLSATRERTKEQLLAFHGGVKRILNPHRYPNGLENRLHELRTQLILEARERGNTVKESA